jgi:hypothetical protein
MRRAAVDQPGEARKSLNRMAQKAAEKFSNLVNGFSALSPFPGLVDWNIRTFTIGVGN